MIKINRKKHLVADRKIYVLTALIAIGLGCGCRSAADYHKQADQAAYSYISNTWNQVSVTTNSFSIDRPSDTLRKRLFTEQQLISYTNNVSSVVFTNKPIIISLEDAIIIAARNSNDFQAEKENLFKVALNLKLQDHEFDTSYQGMISALLSSSDPGKDSESTGVEGAAATGIFKKFKTGASLSGQLAFDVVKLLTLDKSSAYGLMADMSVSIPLLQGAGYDVNTEELTQAQQNLLYAVRDFVKYRQEFIYSVSLSYLNTIKAKQRIENSEANYKRVNKSTERILSLADAGRMSANDVGQALQDRISAENSVVAARNTYASQLDNFKVLIGLPPDAQIEIDEKEADNLRKLAKENRLVNPELLDINMTPALIYTAFTNRMDFLNTIDRIQDAKRKVKIAENNLKADLTLNLNADVGDSKSIGDSDDVSFHLDEGSYSGILELDLPWDRTEEMIAFRKSLINYDNAVDDLRDAEDNLKLDIRNDIRDLIELNQTFILQKEAVVIASNRVESTELFLQAGRVEVRDLLTAQNALFSADDALSSAIVDLYMAGLKMELDTGTISTQIIDQ